MADIEFKLVEGRLGNIGLVTLNRPAALNALNFDMIMSLLQQLQSWQDEPDVHAVWIASSSSPAFCAGGDVVSLYKKGAQRVDEIMPFFKNEYQLNCLIRAYKKPYICFLDGITLGGGVGISLHGSHPLATENFSFAMPETGIGFFPDVGGGYLLTRAIAPYGLYLALTGMRIDRDDAERAGLIKHKVAAHSNSALFEALLASDLTVNAHEVVDEVLKDFADDAPSARGSKLEPFLEDMSHAFSQDSVENIFDALAALDSEWSNKTLKLLHTKSPTALKVTFEQLKRCQGLSMAETMAIEYQMTNQFMQEKDFYEGVRALLVDKDNAPNWQPKLIGDVSNNAVANYF